MRPTSNRLKSESMKKKSYEVGVVYERSGRLYLAVSQTMLISYRRGKISKTQPSEPASPVRSVSVEDLCSNWGVDLDEFDHLTKDYLNPPKAVSRGRPGRQSRNQESEEDYWKKVRSGRITGLK